MYGEIDMGARSVPGLRHPSESRRGGIVGAGDGADPGDSMIDHRLVVSSVVLAAALGATAGCKSYEGPPTGSTCPPGSTLTYANFGQAFMDTNCNSCHAGKERPSLTTQAQIKANIAPIDRTSAAGPNATNTSMPEDGDVSVDDRKKLGEWLACGAP